MSSEPASPVETISPENAATTPNSANAPASGALAGFVRKAIDREASPADAASTASSENPSPVAAPNRGPQGAQGNRGGQGGPRKRGGGGAAGQRKPKPPGGDAAGDDGERPDYEAREAFKRHAVAVPSKRGLLSDDLEAELAAAMGGKSIDEIVAEGSAAKPGLQLEADTRVRGTVVKVHGDNVFVSLGGPNEGVASLRSFAEPPQPGEPIEVVIGGLNRDDGLYELGVPGGKIVSGDWSDIREGSIVEARVSAANTGGLECTINNLRGFIPAGQVAIYRTENLGDYVGQKLVCVVTEANERRGNLVLSRRAILEREKAEAKEKLLANLEPGQTYEGVVRKIMDFGAFVDIGGVDGLLHIAQLSWERIKHPSEVLTEGQKITVRIEKVDPETKKISLAYKNEADHPWKDIEKKFQVGTMAKGVVSRLAEFGAFVKLAPGVEGLVHISELAHHKVFAVKNVVNEGQDVEVKILSIDPEAQRMSLSLKAAVAPPEPKNPKKKEEEPEDEPKRAPAIPKREGPLRGGTKRTSGGEQFGLKW